MSHSGLVHIRHLTVNLVHHTRLPPLGGGQDIWRRRCVFALIWLPEYLLRTLLHNDRCIYSIFSFFFF